MSEKVYYIKELNDNNRFDWVTGLNESGYAGINKQGALVDRREFPNASPIPENTLFGVAKPKDL